MGVESLQFFRREGGRILAALDAVEHQTAGELVGLMKGETGARERFGYVGCDDPGFGAGLFGNFGIEGEVAGDDGGHVQAGDGLIGSIEELLLVFLHVAIVGEREAFHRDE